MSNEPTPIHCIAGYLEIETADLGAFYDAARAMMAETQKEEGCMVYEFSQDLNNPARLRLYEEWESWDHVRAHAVSDHMKIWSAALEEMGVKEREIQTFMGSSFREL